MHSKLEPFWKRVFEPDCGSLRDIRVYGVGRNDYRILLEMLNTRYHAVMVRNDQQEVTRIPDYTVIAEEAQLDNSVRLKFYAADVLVHLWFWDESEINLDLQPEDVDSWHKAQAIFDLMIEIADLLNKRVLLTWENVSATREWSEQFAVCSAYPMQGELVYHGFRFSPHSSPYN
jgi:hypothetical protein